MTETILKSPREKELIQILEMKLKPLGFRPVDVDFRQGGRSLVRIFIDKIRGEGENLVEDEKETSVTVDDCTSVSNQVGLWLDELGWILGAYDLEVSSPGLDRRLRLKSDFEAFRGEKVKLSLVPEAGGRSKQWEGILTKVEAEGICVNSQGKEVSFRYQDINRAIRIWQFK